MKLYWSQNFRFFDMIGDRLLSFLDSYMYLPLPPVIFFMAFKLNSRVNSDISDLNRKCSLLPVSPWSCNYSFDSVDLIIISSIILLEMTNRSLHCSFLARFILLAHFSTISKELSCFKGHLLTKINQKAEESASMRAIKPSSFLFSFQRAYEHFVISLISHWLACNQRKGMES